ncbi:class A beta-lactamase-related serine hydrolase [Amycolatopsis sp. FU40]|uniref:serine hydrolase n=1 Tax=Amycolatopsis sp. FU40 TaxID=2914159 RepID=UPI001F2CE136|nr:serine hydrolase [Amycolatopsis sp. FU40]UKD55352.1 class A beta-lactamase-related serine hydrolase [Amycolatopsis sp. FU40]
MLTRRSLLTSVAAAGAATFVLPSLALADPPDQSTPEGWLARLAAHRDDVAAVFSDGAGRRFGHLADRSLVVASAIKVVHLLAYTTAVAEGRLDPDEQVRVGDWDARHPYIGDGAVGKGNHHTALTYLGVPCDEYGVAKNPDQRVPLRNIAEMMIFISDNSAADYLRARLGDRALRAAAARGGWRMPDVRMFGGEVLLLYFPEYCPPPGSPVAVRRAAGDALSNRFACDPSFRAKVLPRAAEKPPSVEAIMAWTELSGRGSAAQLFRMHQEISVSRDRAAVLAQEILGVPLSGDKPPGSKALLYKGGNLPGCLVLGFDVLWPDRRPGTSTIFLKNCAPEDFAHVPVLQRMCIDALFVPGTFAALERALGH